MGQCNFCKTTYICSICETIINESFYHCSNCDLLNVCIECYSKTDKCRRKIKLSDGFRHKCHPKFLVVIEQEGYTDTRVIIETDVVSVTVMPPQNIKYKPKRKQKRKSNHNFLRPSTIQVKK